MEGSDPPGVCRRIILPAVDGVPSYRQARGVLCHICYLASPLPDAQSPQRVITAGIAPAAGSWFVAGQLDARARNAPFVLLPVPRKASILAGRTHAIHLQRPPSK
jgi:hypothetical protein